MPRIVWLVICLISLGFLLALRNNIGARPIDGQTALVLAISADPSIDVRPPLPKSDRLPSPYFDKPAAKAAGTVPIAPAASAPAIAPKAKQPVDPPSQATADANEVTTWHWHAGSKITKQTTTAPRDGRN